MDAGRTYIDGSYGKLFRDHKEHPVYIMENGKFAVLLTTKGYTKAYKLKNSIREIDKLLASLKEPLKIMTADSDPLVIDAIEYTADGVVVSKSGGRHNAKYGMRFYLYDESAIAKLQEIDKRRQAADLKFNAEQEAVRAGLTRLTPEMFKTKKPK